MPRELKIIRISRQTRTFIDDEFADKFLGYLDLIGIEYTVDSDIF